MTRCKQTALLCLALIVTLTANTAAQAQFGINLGGIRVGGGSKGSSGMNLGNIVRKSSSSNRNSGSWQKAAEQIIRQQVSQPRHRTYPVIQPRPIVQPRPVVKPPCQPICIQPAPIVDPIVVHPAPAPQPIAPPAAPPVPSPESIEAEQALKWTLSAQRAFADGYYALAGERMTQAIAVTPESSAAYQFRALTQFARGDYDKAAADVYETLLRGPLWSWGTIHPLYKNPDTYTKQYKTLISEANADDTSMSKHFLLAYHHLVLGHLNHGEAELKKVLEIQPEEPVTTQLLSVVQKMQANNAVAMK